MRRTEKSQAMTEFALVAPVLLLLTFGIIDFGRALYFYTASGTAAREAARVAVRASTPLPTNSDIRNAAAVHFPGASVTVPGGCYNGPIPSGQPTASAAWVFITEPNPPAAIENLPPPNAPGGESAAGAGGPCSAVNPAIGYQQLQVTVVYNFVPVTPLVSNVIGDHVVFVLRVIARTSY
jgi:hypothetical protein